MKTSATAREALIADAIGDLGRLINEAQSLQSVMNETRQALVESHGQLADQLARFEADVLALAERAEVQTVKHILRRIDQAVQKSGETQTRAMADAARIIFKAELGNTLQRLQQVREPVGEQTARPWERWLSHAAAASSASALTLLLAVLRWPN